MILEIIIDEIERFFPFLKLLPQRNCNRSRGQYPYVELDLVDELKGAFLSL
jgi:hypothetical protein